MPRFLWLLSVASAVSAGASLFFPLLVGLSFNQAVVIACGASCMGLGFAWGCERDTYRVIGTAFNFASLLAAVCIYVAAAV